MFVVFGAGKFVDHASEATSLQGYGLSWPSLFADVIGVLELAGGVLLSLGLGTRVNARLLAGDMMEPSSSRDWRAAKRSASRSLQRCFSRPWRSRFRDRAGSPWMAA